MSKNILVVGETATLAHVVRPLMVAQALHEQGFIVHFATDTHFSSLFAKVPFKVHRIFSRSPAEFRKTLESNGLVFPYDLVRAYVEEEFQLLQEIKPDAVVHDFRRSLTVSAVKMGIPLLSITNAYWSPHIANRTIPAPYSPAIAKLAKEGSEDLDAAVNEAESGFNSILPQIIAAQAAGLDSVRAEHGLAAFPDYLTGAVWGDRVLYADLESVVQLEEKPMSHSFLGPIHWAPTVPLPEWWRLIPDESKLVYVSIGSSGYADVFSMIAEVAPTFDCYFVIATGGVASLSSIRLPPKCFAADFLPGEIIAKRASLIITNGGSPSAYQAFTAGVPILGIPFNMDQLLFMSHATRTEAARSIRADCLTAKTLRDNLENLLSQPNYSASAKLLQQQCQKADFRKECSQLVLGALSGEPSSVGNW